MDKKQIHADVIKAWADGKDIEYSNDGKTWYYTEHPEWSNNVQYRVRKEDTYKEFEGIIWINTPYTGFKPYPVLTVHHDFPVQPTDTKVKLKFKDDKLITIEIVE